MKIETSTNSLRPTDVQLRTLQVIVDFRDRFRHSPSLAEIAVLVGKTRQRVSVEVQVLQRKGLLTCTKYGHRSIAIDPKVEKAVRRSMKANTSKAA